jgi:hypothetical protein
MHRARHPHSIEAIELTGKYSRNRRGPWRHFVSRKTQPADAALLGFKVRVFHENEP